MRSLGLLLATACCSAYASTHTRSFHEHVLKQRNIVSSIADSYDFVIIGGGTAGLTLASRLSEDANHTVLVLEAGDTGELVQDRIDIPSNTYYDGLLGTSYDWQFNTVAQPNAAGRNISWPRGKVLGGSSAVNGLYAVRPSQLEFDTWSSLLDGADGADAWNWENTLAAMKKSETFNAPSSAMASVDTLEFNAGSHGTKGPLHVSWPDYMLPIISNWSSTLSNVGVPTNPDPYGGTNNGAFIALSAINPSNWTRSYARSAYIDPLPPRANLAILPNATVTRIYFDPTTLTSNATATTVEWAASSTGPRNNVTVNKEVILAGGAIGSPFVLMQSGVGPQDVLQAAGVDVVIDLPGVGQHMMDHISTGVTWTTSAATSSQLRDAGDSDPGFLSFVNEAEAYLNITTLLGTTVGDSWQQNISSSMSTYAASLVPSTDSTVVAGYEAIYNVVANTFMLSELGHVEILFSAQGQKGSTTQSVQVQTALQHPFSQGSLKIASADPFADPVIDPQYLSHPFDVVALREALKLARTIGQTAPLSAFLLTEVSPGPSVSTDDEWDTWLAGSIGTEYHPANTCAMLPKEKGGVVDPKLVVYGTSNVRVADASIFPIQFAAHLQLSVYAVAETAAEIVRAQYNGTPAPGESTNASATATGSAPSATSQDTKSTSGAPSEHARLSTALLVCVLGSVIAAFSL
ncbi:hypothetical protein EW145_g1185 [Phellinidium pouzarii]|uniref:Glucose-methanol-choline oxidoreductase N-terminal domain-containing protein n=1 Tax=Phellinidium pouzarii TaxID=167371 RepID=A0A4S4LFB5_9AGAM|nr:hypothetical protein EW145_g1185 [Phellinidium pouzarii]